MSTVQNIRTDTRKGERTPNPTFDHDLSRRLDQLICALEDDQSSRLRRRWLRLQKLMAERYVPVTCKGGAR